METIELKTNVRKSSGTGPGKALRREGRIPAVLYGPNSEPVLLSVNTKELQQIMNKGAGSHALLNLLIQNGETTNRMAMIKELQTHPVSRNFLHVDFYEVAMDRKIKVNIPIVATGTSKGVELGGVLQIVRRELEVLCLPHEIPETIEVDVTDLDVGDSIHVDEIPLGENIEIPEDVNFTIFTVVAPKAEEEVVEEELDEELEGEEGEEGEGEAPAEEDAKDTTKE